MIQQGEKRTRSEMGVQECPICYVELSARTKTRPFQCDHGLCRSCAERMHQESDHRCPECRAPRRGMSREEAEPPPDRNADPLTMDMTSLLQLDVGQEMQEMQAFHERIASLTRAAGGYGLAPGRRRPQTGHVMFFPTQEATPLSGLDGLDGLDGLEDLHSINEMVQRTLFGEGVSQRRLPSDLANAALMQARGGAAAAQMERTVAAMQSSLAAPLVEALLNLPSNPSLTQWHALRVPPPAPAPAPAPTPARQPVRRGRPPRRR